METDFAYQARFTYDSIPDEIPSFEDAFDTTSLKRFYRQQQSHQSCAELGAFYSTYDSLTDFKESTYRESSPMRFFTEDNQFESFLNAKPVASSMPLLICGSPDSTTTASSKTKGVSGGFFDNFYQLSPRMRKNSDFVKKPFEIIRTKQQSAKELPTLKISFKGLDLFTKGEKFLSQSTVDMETEEMSSFDRLLRTKKVFKIVRETKQKVAAPKRKTSAQISTGLQIKKNKSASPKMVAQEIPLEKSMNGEFSLTKERSVSSDHLSLMHLLDMFNQKTHSQQQVMNGVQQTRKSKEHH